MDQELQTEMLTGSWRTLLYMLRAGRSVCTHQMAAHFAWKDITATDLIFNMTMMTSYFQDGDHDIRSLLHTQDCPPAARQPAERVWRYWLAVRCTVPEQ